VSRRRQLWVSYRQGLDRLGFPAPYRPRHAAAPVLMRAGKHAGAAIARADQLSGRGLADAAQVLTIQPPRLTLCYNGGNYQPRSRRARPSA
jgi:hypothetical protein